MKWKFYFYKLFLCSLKGHCLLPTQNIDMPNYFLNVCNKCGYTDGVKHLSPINIMNKNNGKVEIHYFGTGGSGGSGD